MNIEGVRIGVSFIGWGIEEMPKVGSTQCARMTGKRKTNVGKDKYR